MSKNMKLKALRVQYGITQHELAKRLETTQQTIARWESGKSSIPAKHLRDIAVLLGCSVESLLNTEGDHNSINTKHKNTHKPAVENSPPYGTVIVDFGGDVGKPREWPITCSERIYLLNQMQAREGDGMTSSAQGWIYFETLDDRIVFINTSELESLRLISDDAQEMPEYAHLEIYTAIRKFMYETPPNDENMASENYPYTRPFQDQCMSLIEQWGGNDDAINHMECVLVESTKGVQRYLAMEEEGAQDLLFAMQDYEGRNLTHQFANLESEGYHKASFYRFGALRLIELSNFKWKELIGESRDEDEQEQKEVL
jgi:transcriptional regulator with XRE-family HTH domain